MKKLLGLTRIAPLLLLVAGVIAMACGQETIEPAPTATSDSPAPAATFESTAPPATAVAAPLQETPVPITVPQEPTAVPTEIPASTAPTPTQPAASDRTPSGDSASVVLLGSHSVAAPSGPGSFGGFSLSPAPQTFATSGGLTVSAIGSVTVAADEAYVVVIPEMGYGPSGPEQLSDKDRDQIVANLEAIGLSEDAVEFEHVSRYEPAIISVEVDVAASAAEGESIVDAVEEVVRRSESYGVRFGLSEDNCEQAVSLARREAAPAAEKAADDLADALGVERGVVNGALEYPLQSDPYRWLGAAADRCGGGATYRFGILLPFDSDPEVEVSVGLQISYDLR